MIRFKGIYFPEKIILCSVFFSVRYAASSRDLEGTLTERVRESGSCHAQSLVSYSSALALETKNRKRAVAAYWHLDETKALIGFRGDTQILLNP